MAVEEDYAVCIPFLVQTHHKGVTSVSVGCSVLGFHVSVPHHVGCVVGVSCQGACVLAEPVDVLGRQVRGDLQHLLGVHKASSIHAIKPESGVLYVLSGEHHNTKKGRGLYFNLQNLTRRIPDQSEAKFVLRYFDSDIFVCQRDSSEAVT